MATVATPVSAEQNTKIAELSKQLSSEGEQWHPAAAARCSASAAATSS